jgi:hypothetical protein
MMVSACSGSASAICWTNAFAIHVDNPGDVASETLAFLAAAGVG